MPIEKILHVVWVGPHDPPKELIDSWEKKHNNGWFFVLWRSHVNGDGSALWENDAVIRRLQSREWNGVCDVMRYEILFNQGGFVVDADSECIKALDEGPEDFLANETAVACYENESVRPGIVGCGFLGAPKGHPFMRACVDEVSKCDPSLPAWRCVGTEMITRVARANPDLIRVYPAKMFNPVHYSGAPAPGDHPVYASQKWGGTKGYGSLRRLPCWCPQCRVTMLRPPWG